MNNRMALESVFFKAQSMGFDVRILTDSLQGEAREIGASLARLLDKARIDSGRQMVLLAGGETTVSVRGRGKGGRNQELCLSALLGIAGRDGICIASMGTDGLDGSTDAAGAIVDGHSLELALSEGLDAEAYLRENDSYAYFQRLGDLIVTGPTGTNVSDILVLVAL